MEKNEAPDAEDTSNMQVQGGNTDSQVNNENQIQINLMIRHRKHHKMIIIELQWTMMSRTLQYNLVIQ